MIKRLLLSVISTFFIITCDTQNSTKLVVFIVADQSSPFLLEKYDHLFTGGFRWLTDNGIVYNNAHHNHGNTSTGPGHFSLSTGVFTGNGGIVDNEWYDRKLKRSYYVVEDTTVFNLSGKDIGRSYQNIQNTNLADWIGQSNPNSKVVSLSGKDRSAVLFGGSDPDLVLWYDKKGNYTTSTFYTESLPIWVQNFNAKLNVRGYKDSTWSLLKDSEIYEKNTRVDNFKGEKIVSKKPDATPTLPLLLGDMSTKKLLNDFYEYPHGDRSLIDLAIESISRLDLGSDYVPDLLFLGLSATDGVGHNFGPHSVEQLDNHLRLDNQLMRMINYIEDKVGDGNTMYVFSSDHGSMELPESLQLKRINAGRVSRKQEKKVFSQILSQIKLKIGAGKVVEYGNNFYFDQYLTDKEKEYASEVIKNLVFTIDGVSMALSPEEIMELPYTNENMRLKNMIHPNKSPDIYVILKENWLWTSKVGTSHGSHYSYDSHIPLIFSKKNIKSYKIDDAVFSVDASPSIAKYLGLIYPKNLDGSVLNLKFDN
jgi:predicted AlkP superfamily pyrophosphatase or phosphodiesterase